MTANEYALSEHAISARKGNGDGNGNGTYTGLPLWARVVGLVGIPGTIALFAVWVGSQSIPKMQTEITVLREAVQSQTVAYEKLTVVAEEHTRLLQKICSAQFKTEEEKQRCFDR